MPASILSVRNLRKFFPIPGGWLGKDAHYVRAVDDVSFDLAPGETLGLVGESGCGKTTAGRVIMGLEKATQGEVRLNNSQNLALLTPKEWRPFRRQIQMIFQDPYSSLNPRMTVGAIISEPIAVHGLAKNRAERRDRVASLFEQVGLPADAMERYPHEFSGGQRQRVG
ncbi:TPA: peptide ABC transporter substrate-binding protein, partial [Candidatus Sumerlaeota bacterium]|nr:peptide ABC transporter substrate-binding protein [Candidatus Sumerlaeota bacterium]